MAPNEPVSHNQEVTEPAIVVVWDPELVSPEDYAELLNAVGNVVRANGGLGIKLLFPMTMEAEIETGVPA